MIAVEDIAAGPKTGTGFSSMNTLLPLCWANSKNRQQCLARVANDLGLCDNHYEEMRAGEHTA